MRYLQGSLHWPSHYHLWAFLLLAGKQSWAFPRMPEHASDVQCIRSSFDVMKEKKCPACDAIVTEGSIRRNRALEEITDAWEAARWVRLWGLHRQPIADRTGRVS